MHLTAYAAIALAWFHEIPTGGDINPALPPRRARPTGACSSSARSGCSPSACSSPLWNALRYRLRVAEVIAEGPTVTSIRITGRGLDRLRRPAGPVLPLALPDARVLVDGAPVLALGRARRALAPDQRQGGGRPHGADRARCRSGRASSPRARSARSPRRRRQRQGAADRGRDRDHAGARARRDDGRRPRRDPPRARRRRHRLRATSSTQLAGAPRRRACHYVVGDHARRRRAATCSRPPTCASSCPTSPSATSTSAARPRWSLRSRRTSAAPGFRAAASTSSGSRSEAARGSADVHAVNYGSGWTTARRDDLEFWPDEHRGSPWWLVALRRRRRAVVVAVPLALGAPGARRREPGNAVNGKKVYIQFCGKCHTLAAAGSQRHARAEPRPGQDQLQLRRERDREGRRRHPGRVRPPQRHLQPGLRRREVRRRRVQRDRAARTASPAGSALS